MDSGGLPHSCRALTNAPWGRYPVGLSLALSIVMPVHIDRLLEEDICSSSYIERHRMKPNLSSVSLTDFHICFVINSEIMGYMVLARGPGK